MANAFSDYAFLHNNLNLNRLDLGAYDANFYDDANIEFNSINYQDVYEIYWTYGDGFNVSAFAGPSLNVSSGVITGGTVTGYLEGYWDGSAWQYTWGLQNISVDGAALIGASRTAETEDDYLIFDAVISGADVFNLSQANDFAYGLAGDDTLNGYGGSDTLYGDAGDDTLNGGDGDDILYGGIGTDTLDGGAGDDTLNSGAGDDTLDGGDGNDTLDGGAGDDVLNGGAGDDVLVQSGSGTQHYDGGVGIDTYKIDVRFLGTDFKDVVKVDLASGFSGLLEFPELELNDTLVNLENINFGNMASNLELIGDNADNVLTAGAGDDTLNGGAGDDTLNGGDGDDVIDGGDGDDVLDGGAGDDTLDGGDGDDNLNGGDGDDIIYTSTGNDIYDGGDGVDTVITDYTKNPPSLGSSSILKNIENQFFIGDTNITINRSEDPNSGDNYIKADVGNDRVLLGVGNDKFELGSGKNYSNGGDGDDTIILEGNGTFGSDLFAYNTTSSLQAGTEKWIVLNGKTRFEDVMDGGADIDTVELTDSSDAFFLHDSFGGFHSSLTLVEDYDSRLGAARIANIENINSGAGDDIVDLTSPDYSLVGQNITVDGGSGDDTLWGSDANETLLGGEGDDELFGGAGTNVLTGGAGADEFQFTKTSTNDTVKDFSLSDGDTLKFFNTGGAQFDLGSVSLTGDVLSISDGTGVLTITLEGTGLQLADLGSDVLIIG